MSARIVLTAACVCAITAGSAHAQQPFHDLDTTEFFHQIEEAAEAFHAAVPQAEPRLLPPARVAPSPPTPQTPRTPTLPQVPAPPVPKVSGQSVNVKVEFVITDQRDGAAPVKKTVSATVADGNLGSIRASSTSGPSASSFQTNVPLNIDATPTLLADGKIRLQFTLQYEVPGPAEASSRTGFSQTSLRNSMTLILESGKGMQASQSADPTGDRQVKVDVTATILK